METRGFKTDLDASLPVSPAKIDAKIVRYSVSFC